MMKVIQLRTSDFRYISMFDVMFCVFFILIAVLNIIEKTLKVG